MSGLAGLTIAAESPLGADLALLHARHTADMHSETPPESIHMLPADALAAPGIAFFVMRDAGVPVAMGAFKRLSGTGDAAGTGAGTGAGAEIKSMHVLAEHRGRGLSKRMLEHLIAEARAAGVARLWLETGVQPGFAAARTLYAQAGFVECGPFEGYGPDPNSLFMTRALD